MGSKLHQMPKMPKRMKERFMDIFGSDYDSFADFCKSDFRRSFRINTLKIDVEKGIEMLKGNGFEIENIPWTRDGFWTDDKTIGNSFEHFMGYIYIQGQASMVPAIALDPKPGETVLDMCAAPGSKSTQIASMMQNKGVLFLNDVDYRRIKMLRYNNDKAGMLNTITTNMNAKNFENMKIRFDKILLDAPCTGEGILMREWQVINRWNMKNVINMCRLQKALIKSAVSALKKNGTLVYSTCTLSPEENEEVIDYALTEIGGLEIEKINIKNLKTRPGLTAWDRYTYDERVKDCISIWPQDNKTEGFFVAKIKKV